MPVTLKEVAELAGVSTSAVSRTFTEGASVSAKMRAKVHAAAEQLGYAPNVLASGLSTGRTKLIGLISNNFHNPIFLEVFDRFTRGLQERGLRPLIVNLTEETDPFNSVRLLRQYSVDGVIVASSTLPPAFALAFRQAGMPVVHTFGRRSAHPEVDVIGIDNVACGAQARRTLIERGYRRIAFLGGPEQATSTQDRLKGFLRGRADGVTVSYSFADAYSFEAGRDEMTRLLQSEDAEAFFCADDVLSIGAIAALRGAGRRVPQDVGIIGLNDMEMAGWESIDLTTIHQPISAIIEASIDRVIALLGDPRARPQSQVLSCRLVERGTLRRRDGPQDT
ncbi:MAG: LacI family DNA-binding transcriptional regulator [Pseudomonadota bacterium]